MKKAENETIVGVLALQGGVREHIEIIESFAAKAREVRTVSDLEGIDGLIMPGGESTAIGRLIDKNGLREPLKKRISTGMPVWGTCAGAILLAKKGSEFSLGLLNIDVERNAYGSQLDSFIAPLRIAGISEPFEAVFIRAPQFTRLGDGVKILAEHAKRPVFVCQGGIWASSFHPELSENPGIHRLFVDFCGREKTATT